MLSDDQLIKIIEENGRMKGALLAIATLASESSFGAWRHKVYQMARIGMQVSKDKIEQR